MDAIFEMGRVTEVTKGVQFRTEQGLTPGDSPIP